MKKYPPRLISNDSLFLVFPKAIQDEIIRCRVSGAFQISYSENITTLNLSDSTGNNYTNLIRRI